MLENSEVLGDSTLMENPRQEYPLDSEKVISPFAHSQATVSGNKGSGGNIILLIGLGLILIIGGAIGGMFTWKYLNDPYRTLETFPVSKYLDDYKSLAGSKYKAVFQVEADLGWKDGAGRLMLFSTQDDSRPFAVLIPASVANGLYFSKGQSYIAEVEVKEGGLIYAYSCQKN